MNAQNQNDPSVQILGLKNGEHVSGKRQISATVSQKVSNIRYLLTNSSGDIVMTRYRRQAPYALAGVSSDSGQPRPLDTADYPDGPYTLRALGYSQAGYSVGSEKMKFTIDQSAPPSGREHQGRQDKADPTMTVSGLAAGQDVVGPLRVTVSADQPISSVDFAIPGIVRRTEREAPYSLAGDANHQAQAWDTDSVDDGAYQLAVKVHLDSGEQLSRRIPFTIDNHGDDKADSSQPSTGDHEADASSNDSTHEAGREPTADSNASDESTTVNDTDKDDSADNQPNEPKVPAGKDESQDKTPEIQDDAEKDVSIDLRGLSDGQTVHGDLVVIAEPSSASVDTVRFQIPGQVDQTEHEVPYAMVGNNNGTIRAWDSTNASDGVHQLKVTASLADGRLVHKTVKFTVDNGRKDSQADDDDLAKADKVTDTVNKPGVGPKVLPGTGFTGPTPQPDRQGKPGRLGYDFQAMARFDVVPDQTFTDKFEIGVVAFHCEGIDRVEFSANGGPWTVVKEPSLNPRTKVNEYWAVLDAADFDPGQLHVRAVVYPNVGLPRVLPYGDLDYDTGLPLNADPNRTLPRDHVYVLPRDAKQQVSDKPGGGRKDPFGSIKDAVRALNDRDEFSIAGATIYLLPGEYEVGDVGNPRITRIHRWMTVTKVPHAKREEVRIVKWDSPGLNMNRLRLKDVTYAPEDGGKMSNSHHTDPDYFWADHARLEGSSRYRTDGMQRGFSLTFETDSLYTNTHSGFSGDVVRNCRVVGVIDAFSRPGLVVNCSAQDVNDIERGPAHPDVIDYGSPDKGDYLTNKIVYGLTADKTLAQGLITKNLNIKGMALVNVSIDNVTGVRKHGVVNLHLDSRIENMYIKDSRFYGRCSLRTDKTFDAHGLIFENTQVGTSPPWTPDKLPLKGVYLRGYSNGD